MSKLCNGCKMCEKDNMAQIPYIEHKNQMFKAYCRELGLKRKLILSNILWAIAVVVVLLVR